MSADERDMDFLRWAHTIGMLRPPEEAAALLRWLCGPDGAAYHGQVVTASDAEMRARTGLPALAR